MAEILDPDGVWTSELLELMLPVAIEREAEQASNHFGATLAAISSLSGGEGVEAFEEGIRSIKEQTRNAAREARGLNTEKPKPKKHGATAADKMLKVAQKMGLTIERRAGKKAKAPKPEPAKTRVHKRK